MIHLVLKTVDCSFIWRKNWSCQWINARASKGYSYYSLLSKVEIRKFLGKKRLVEQILERTNWKKLV